MDRFIEFLNRPRISRRQYWPTLAAAVLMGAGGVLLLQQPLESLPSTVMWTVGILALLFAVGLSFLLVAKRVKDIGFGWLPLIIAISIGGRLAKAAVLVAGGSRDQSDMALGAVFALVLVALGCMPGKLQQPVNTESDVSGDPQPNLGPSL